MTQALLNYSQLNTARLNEGTGDFPFTTAHHRYAYRMELHDDTGAFVAWLPYYQGASFVRTVNAPSALSFEYPLAPNTSAAEGVDLLYPNQVWMLDGAGNLLEKFHIVSTQESNAVDGASVSVDCESLLRQLSNEWIVDYEATPAQGKTISQIIGDWLNESTGVQTHASPIRKGLIDGSIGSLVRAVTVKRKTVLQAINELLATTDSDLWPWYMYVHPRTRALNIALTIGEQKGQQIRYKKNLAGITRSIDPDQLITRLYAYGKDGLTLIDAGETYEYINDAAAQSLYGVKVAIIEQNDIEDADTLLAYAQAYLANNNAPKITYSIDAADLSQAQRGSFAFESLQLGSVVRVINDYPAVNVETRVQKITVDPACPVKLKIALESVDKNTLENIIADLLKKADNDEPVVISSDLPLDIGTASAGVSDEVAAADHVHGGSVALSNATPQAVAAAASAGDDSLASRADHIHVGVQLSASTPAAVAAAGSAGSGTAASKSDHVHAGLQLTSAAAEVIISGTSTAGTGTTAAKVDHQHQGMPWVQATSKANLPASADGVIGYDTTGDKLYARCNGVWVCISHTEAPA